MFRRLALTVALLAAPAFSEAAGTLATPAIEEPFGYVLRCYATNLDTKRRTIGADIVDISGSSVTFATSCGSYLGGYTCFSEAFPTNSLVRCIVSTDGAVKNLRGSLASYATYPGPANVVVPAQ